MPDEIKINVPFEAIADFCGKWDVKEFAVFGSALRDDFGPESDIDVLVTFNAGARRTFFHLVNMQKELEAVFGRKVDILSRRGVEAGRNHVRRKEILDSAKVIYVA